MAKKVIVFAPHPDDAEFYAGGTLAKMIAEGFKVVIVVATDSSKGSFEHAGDALAALRRSEALQAAKVLGAEPPIMLGYRDFELDKLPAGQLREQFIHHIRQQQPDVVFTEDAFANGEVHHDHRAVAWAASDAINYATLPLLHPEHLTQGLDPHFVVEKYFFSDDLGDANKVVDISETFERKIAALTEHKSQIKFLVEGILNEARLAGVDLAGLLGAAASNHLMAFTWAMQTQAAGVGLKAGFTYGEAFRYVRFHPFVENILSTQN